MTNTDFSQCREQANALHLLLQHPRRASSWHGALDVALRASVSVMCVATSPDDAPTAWAMDGIIFAVAVPPRDEHIRASALIEQLGLIMAEQLRVGPSVSWSEIASRFAALVLDESS